MYMLNLLILRNFKSSFQFLFLFSTLTLPYILAICDSPASFWIWFDDGCDEIHISTFLFLVDKYKSNIQLNRPITFLKDLSNKVPLCDMHDFEIGGYVEKAASIIKNKPADSSTYKFRKEDTDGTGFVVDITLTNGKKTYYLLSTYYCHL